MSSPQKWDFKLHTYWRNAHLRVAGYPPVDAGTHTPYNPRGQLSQGEIEREIG